MSSHDFEPWNDNISTTEFNAANKEYNDAILEQYKLYVEMADRISHRRSLTNTFFLAFNAIFMTAATTVLGRHFIPAGWLAPLLAVLLIQCATWHSLMRSYRLLNSRKFRIIGAIEQRLPARPWDQEWKSLGTGRGVKRYWRLTLLEQWVPMTFGIAYFASYATYLFK